MPTRSNYGTRQMHTTTVMIPAALAAEVQKRGMTFSGAFVQGFAAIDRQLTLNANTAELESTIRSQQRTIARLEGEIEKYVDKLSAVRS